MLEYLIHISPLGSFIATALWFVIGLPAMLGAYYQSWKARQEAYTVSGRHLQAGRLYRCWRDCIPDCLQESPGKKPARCLWH